MINQQLTPSEAYDTLRREPVYFLKHYPVRVNGTGVMPGVESVVLRRREAARSQVQTRNRIGRTSLLSTISFEVRTANRLLDQHFNSVATQQPLAHRPFPAHFVHMSPDMQQMQPYQLKLGGPKVMVTPQLTGCSFVMEPAAPGEVTVTHVRPGAEGGAELKTALTAQLGQAQVYGADGSSGNYDSADRIVNIVGVLRDSGWAIYAQKLLRDVDIDRIISVYQIYPTREKL